MGTQTLTVESCTADSPLQCISVSNNEEDKIKVKEEDADDNSEQEEDLGWEVDEGEFSDDEDLYEELVLIFYYTVFIWP